MEEEILLANAKTKKIKALGLEIDAELEQIKVYINGIDILKNIKLEELKIVKEVE